MFLKHIVNCPTFLKKKQIQKNLLNIRTVYNDEMVILFFDILCFQEKGKVFINKK